MSKFAKTAIAAAMVMGAVVSSSAFAAGNNGTARFYGTIEDSPCSIVPDDHKLEVCTPSSIKMRRAVSSVSAGGTGVSNRANTP